MRIARTQVWLWLLVAVQIAIPATYYLTDRDPDDERFSWRMFSGVRLKRCDVRAFEFDASARPQPIALRGTLHGSWVHALERGRQRVIERFLTSRCVRPGVKRALLRRRCTDVHAERLPERSYVYDCGRGTFVDEASP